MELESHVSGSLNGVSAGEPDSEKVVSSAVQLKDSHS